MEPTRHTINRGQLIQLAESYVDGKAYLRIKMGWEKLTEDEAQQIAEAYMTGFRHAERLINIDPVEITDSGAVNPT